MEKPIPTGAFTGCSDLTKQTVLRRCCRIRVKNSSTCHPHRCSAVILIFARVELWVRPPPPGFGVLILMGKAEMLARTFARQRDGLIPAENVIRIVGMRIVARGSVGTSLTLQRRRRPRDDRRADGNRWSHDTRWRGLKFGPHEVRTFLP